MANDIKSVIGRLDKHINSIPKKFLSFSEDELQNKPAPNKWSKKELLGHLIDSAANNHHRFVKAQFETEPIQMQKYEQDDWVNTQKYNEKDSASLVELWKNYNEHILFIMKNTPENKLSVKCDLDDAYENADTLFFLMKDYVDHMDHHFKQIFNN